MIYSYHQMCPALNLKPYWSNKHVVRLLGCCSDAPVFWCPGLPRKPSRDQTFFQPNFGFEIKPEIWLEKIAALLQQLVT